MTCSKEPPAGIELGSAAYVACALTTRPPARPKLCLIFQKLQELYQCPQQYGFRKESSTSVAMLDLLEKMYDCIDKGELGIGVFLDLSKAFDRIDFDILSNKLQYYDVRGTALSWFYSLHVWEETIHLHMQSQI